MTAQDSSLSHPATSPTAPLGPEQSAPLQTLTGSQTQAFMAALLSAFDLGGLRQMTRIYLGQNLDALVSTQNLTTAVFELIEWAQRTGQLTALLEGALAANPGSPALQQFAAAVAPTVRSAPSTGARVGPAPTGAAALILRTKQDQLKLLLAQYEAASRQWQTTLNAADKPALAATLRDLEQQLQELQDDIDRRQQGG